MKRFLGVLCVLVLVFSMAAIALPSPVLAILPSEVWVDDDNCPGPGSGTQLDPFCKIQDGIDAVASPGTVHVAAGNYSENIILKDKVKVLGAGADVTTIDGGGGIGILGVGDVIYINADDVEINGFTIRNSDWGSAYGGIKLYNCYNIAIKNNTITSTKKGVYFSGGSSNITIINNNLTSNWDQGIWMQNSNYVSVVNNRITSNDAHGICGGGNGNVEICGNVFLDNHAAGIGIEGSSVDIVNNIIANNGDRGGPGVDLNISLTTGTGNITNNVIANNSEDGILVQHSSTTIVNNIVTGNGKGIICVWGSTPTISYNDVWGNGANYDECEPGIGDISADPLFVYPAGADYHLQGCSPCIDAGTDTGAPTEDIEGNPRPIDGDGIPGAVTDMGAYEYVPPLPPPVEVGGEVYPVDKLTILAPWIVLVAALLVGTSIAVRRRRA